MLLMLKRDFTFVNKGEIRAYVDQDGILKIDSYVVDWDKMMYALAYHLQDKTVCPYCGNPVRKTKLTMDHMYPRAYGGVSISNNLIPCCSQCNSRKSNLDVEQFMELKKKETAEEQNRFYNETIREKEKSRYTKGFILPEQWVSYLEISELKIRYYYLNSFTESKRQKEIQEYIEKYNHLQRPVIVDTNNWILDGYNQFIAAKRSGRFQKVPVIRLENVELIKF